MKSLRAIGAVVLGTAAAASIMLAQAPVDRSKSPVLGPPPKLSLPPVITRTLPDGLKLLIVEQHELPVADFIMVLGSGATVDPTGKPGLSNLTAAMLTEGTKTRTSLEIADQVAFLGIWLNAASTRIQKNRLTELLQLKDRPTAIANQAYSAILYGSSHPYGQPQIGTEASVNAISPADLQGFYRANYLPNNSTLIIVGDVTAGIEQKVARMFTGWQQGSVVSFPVSEAPKSANTLIYLIDKPGAAQSSFRIGSVGVPRSTRDYFALTVMNTILGGSFTSRLMQNLRETHGYTYGARSSFDMRKAAGPFTASAEVVAAKTDSALLEFMKELNAIRDTVPSTELSKAKRYLQLGLPGDFETTQQIARAMIPIATYGLPLDFYNTYVQNIEAVTQSDVQRVSRQYVNPGSLAIVIVGDRKSIEPGLKAVNTAPITLRDFFGQPISQ